MTRSNLIKAACDLYGYGGAALVADRLGIHVRTVERWAAGKAEPSDHAWPGIAKELADCLERDIAEPAGVAIRGLRG